MKTEFLWTYTVHTCSFMAVHLLNINIVFEIHFYNIICTLPSSPYKSRTPFNVRLIHYIFTGQKNFHRFLHQNKSKKKKLYKLILVRVTALDQNVHECSSLTLMIMEWYHVLWKLYIEYWLQDIYPGFWADLTYMVVILSCIMEWCGPIGIGDRVLSTILQQQCHHSRVTYQK